MHLLDLEGGDAGRGGDRYGANYRFITIQTVPLSSQFQLQLQLHL